MVPPVMFPRSMFAPLHVSSDDLANPSTFPHPGSISPTACPKRLISLSSSSFFHSPTPLSLALILLLWPTWLFSVVSAARQGAGSASGRQLGMAQEGWRPRPPAAHAASVRAPGGPPSRTLHRARPGSTPRSLVVREWFKVQLLPRYWGLDLWGRHPSGVMVYSSSVVFRSIHGCGDPTCREFFSVYYQLFSGPYRYHPIISRHYPLLSHHPPQYRRINPVKNGFDRVMTVLTGCSRL
jgi:hypothetical protein